MKKNKLFFFLFFFFNFKNILKNSEKEKADTKVEYLRHKKNHKYIVPLGNHKYRFFLRANVHDMSKVYFVYFINNEKFNKVMKEIGTTRGKKYFYIDLEIKNSSLSYYFHLRDHLYDYYFGEKGSKVLEEIKNFNYSLKNINSNIPEWANNIIIYQIFIDRFRNGDTDNDPIFNQLGSESFSKSKEMTIKNNEKAKYFKWNENGTEFSRQPWNSSWTEKTKWEENFKKDNNWYDSMFRHYGGDIRGVIEKLDYLSELGVNVIYLSPPFYSHSNHKFDVVDFEHISPDIGTFFQTGENYGFDKKVKKNVSEYLFLNYNIKDRMFRFQDFWTQSDLLFARLIKEAHKRDIKVIIEFPFNYVSKKFKFFRHVLYHGPMSKYSKWFIFENWNKVEKKTEKNIDEWNPLISYEGSALYGVETLNDKKYRRCWLKPSNNLNEEELKEVLEWNEKNIRYESFDENGLLPLLNLDNNEVKEFLLKIFSKWILGPDGKVCDIKEDDGIDGFCFDTLNGKFMNFWYDFRKELKEMKDILIISNSLTTHSNGYINNVELNSDLIYNYRFMPSIVKEINNKSSYRVENLKTSLELSRLRSSNLNINVLSTWDTERAFSSIINYQLNNKNTIENKNYRNINPVLYNDKSESILKIASLIQATYSGIPLIYYGDEKGMFGSQDPYNRKPMLWEHLMPFDKEYDSLSNYDESIKRFKGDVDIDEANQKVYYNVYINNFIKNYFSILFKNRFNFKELFSKGNIKILNIKKRPNDIFIYERNFKNETAIIIINLSDKEIEVEVPISKRGLYKNLINEQEEYNIYSLSFKIKVNALSGKLLYSK